MSLKLVFKSRPELFLVTDHHKLLCVFDRQKQVALFNHRGFVHQNSWKSLSKYCTLIRSSSTRRYKDAEGIVNSFLNLFSLFARRGSARVLYFFDLFLDLVVGVFHENSVLFDIVDLFAWIDPDNASR
jgi:hypothetical protein